MKVLSDYKNIVGDKIIHQIYQKASNLYHKHILNINSTSQGGGVAELLSSLVPLINDVGIDTGWRILHGNPDFFTVTKKFHNALQGEEINLTKRKKNLYNQTNKQFFIYTHIDHDALIIHDPQPLPLIKFYQKRQPWIWRCHIDLSAPNPELWNFLKEYILKYDLVILSHEKYKKADLETEQVIIPPAIDPLSLKNKKLSSRDIKKYIQKANIPLDKPLISQVSRMDPWKDPEGLLEVFHLVKNEMDCRLLYCYSSSFDDPEGMNIYSKLRRKVEKSPYKDDVIFIGIHDDILVNVVQRVSSVIIQKSKKEGFGLTVAEALWKEKPVVASAVGGITLQIQDGENGFLLSPNDNQGFADKIIEILKKPSLGKELGRKGEKSTREKFLVTRLLLNYLDILNKVLS